MNSERLSKLAAFLLHYRILDVAASLNHESAACGQPHRLSIPIPPKIVSDFLCHSAFVANNAQYYKHLDQWSHLVMRGLHLLRESEDDLAQMDTAVFPGPDPVESILTSLVRRTDSIEGHKIKANFECAAAYLSLILKVCLKSSE